MLSWEPSERTERRERYEVIAEQIAHIEAVAAYHTAEALVNRSDHGTSITTLDRENRAVQETWEAWLAVDEAGAIAWNEAQ